MGIEQLTVRYLGVCHELAAAYSSVPWNAERVGRLTDELLATERGIAAATGGRLGVKTPLHRHRLAALLGQ